MISHENLMKNGFIRINISLTIGKTSRYYEIIPKQKKSACKKSLFFGGKSAVFSEKSGKWRFYQEKSMGKCYKSYGFSVKKACVHILGSVCI